MKLEFVPTGEMVADVLTKSLVRAKHEKFRDGLGICKGVGTLHRGGVLECTECPYKVWDDLDKSVVRYKCFMC